MPDGSTIIDADHAELSFWALCAMAVGMGLDKPGDDGCGFITVAYRPGAALIVRRHLYGQSARGVVLALCRDLQTPPEAFAFTPHDDEPDAMAWASVADQRQARIAGLDLSARGGLTVSALVLAADVLAAERFNPFKPQPETTTP